MKKFSGTLILLLFIITTFLVLTTTANAESDVEFSFSKVPSDELAIETYCKEIKKRHQLEIETGSFLKNDEVKFLKSKGFNILVPGKIVQMYEKSYGGVASYEFPVIYQGSNGIELWYTNSNGELWVKAISGRLADNLTWRNYGNIHYPESEDEILASNWYYSILYNSQSGEVSIWIYGTLIRKHQIPKNSIYAGKSDNEGYIFRNGTDVYAVRDFGSFTEEYGVYLIAHDVKFVIVTDYKGDGTEDLSQPLFFMNNGTIKCYCTWYNDEVVPIDDESNLIDVRFEGGFNL